MNIDEQIAAKGMAMVIYSSLVCDFSTKAISCIFYVQIPLSVINLLSSPGI